METLAKSVSGAALLLSGTAFTIFSFYASRDSAFGLGLGVFGVLLVGSGTFISYRIGMRVAVESTQISPGPRFPAARSA
jgi:hypothetical protein